MVKLQKDGETYEATELKVYEDYVVITWGVYDKTLTKDEWAKYTVITDESPDEQNEH